ncbi:MAG: sigma-70 family RNA polymerase sigma factor [Lachnospiraceae bacterium]|nr:sigma-70 family RNA polymerase sigma factor [Lachnospiraceae bacterium]
MKTFQKPLTRQEEEQCLLRWEQGDEKARDVLIERNMRLVAHVAKKYGDGERDMEDLISIGTIGLIKAVNTFSSRRGSRLATYAAKCIDNAILTQTDLYPGGELLTELFSLFFRDRESESQKDQKGKPKDLYGSVDLDDSETGAVIRAMEAAPSFQLT